MTTKQKKSKDKIADAFNIEEHIIDCDASHRGGTMKVDVSSIFTNVEDATMGAYQNYLGGGMRGRIVGASMFEPSELTEREQKTFHVLLERIKRYFHDITNSDENSMNDEWNTMSYEKNQGLSVSAY